MSPGAVAAVAPCEGTGSPQLGRSPRLRSWTSERQGCGWASRAIKAGEEEVVTVQPVQCPTLIQLSGNSCWPGTGREPRQQQVRKLPGCSVMGMVEGQCGWEALGEGKHLPANWPAWLSDVKEISQGRRSWGARQGAKCPPPHSSGPPQRPSFWTTLPPSEPLWSAPPPQPWVVLFLHASPYQLLICTCVLALSQKESKQHWAFGKTLARKVQRWKESGEGEGFGLGPSQSEADTRASACST